MDTSNVTMKRCSCNKTCINPLGPDLPMTLEYFSRNSVVACGFHARCRVCETRDNADRRHRNRDKYRERSREIMRRKRADPAYRKLDDERNGARHLKEKLDDPEWYPRQQRKRKRKIGIAIENMIIAVSRICKLQIAQDKKDALEAKRQYKKSDEYKALQKEKRRKWRKTAKQNYYDLNPGRRTKERKAWYDRNPDRKRQKHTKHNQRRRARAAKVESTFTVTEWVNVIKYFNNSCAYCQRDTNTAGVLHQDHYIPLSNSGPYTASNIVPACQDCNYSKSDNNPSEWLRKHFGDIEGAEIEARIKRYFASLP